MHFMPFKAQKIPSTWSPHVSLFNPQQYFCIAALSCPFSPPCQYLNSEHGGNSPEWLLGGDFDDKDVMPANHNQHDGPSLRGPHLGSDGHQMHPVCVTTPECPPKATGQPEKWHFDCEDVLNSFSEEPVPDCSGSDHVSQGGCESCLNEGGGWRVSSASRGGKARA
jgi:hypothetical protein